MGIEWTRIGCWVRLLQASGGAPSRKTPNTNQPLPDTLLSREPGARFAPLAVRLATRFELKFSFTQS